MGKIKEFPYRKQLLAAKEVLNIGPSEADSLKMAMLQTHNHNKIFPKLIMKDFSQHYLPNLANQAFRPNFSSILPQNFLDNQNHITYIATQEVSHLGLIDKVTNLAIENKDAGLVIAGAIGTSIVILAISHSAVKLIEVIRK